MRWIIVLLVIFGNILNVKHDYRGFVLWIIADGSLTILNIVDGDWAEAIIFGIYTIFAIYGAIKWK